MSSVKSLKFRSRTDTRWDFLHCPRIWTPRTQAERLTVFPESYPYMIESHIHFTKGQQQSETCRGEPYFHAPRLHIRRISEGKDTARGNEEFQRTLLPLSEEITLPAHESHEQNVVQSCQLDDFNTRVLPSYSLAGWWAVEPAGYRGNCYGMGVWYGYGTGSLGGLPIYSVEFGNTLEHTPVPASHLLLNGARMGRGFLEWSVVAGQ